MPWHDFEKAKDLPVYILHGELDRIIPVSFARQAKALFERFGYHLVYRELRNWGHAYPFSEIGNICGFFDSILRA
jgi:predicted esterase